MNLSLVNIWMRSAIYDSVISLMNIFYHIYAYGLVLCGTVILLSCKIHAIDMGDFANSTYKAKRSYTIYEKDLLELRKLIIEQGPKDSKKCHYYPQNSVEEFLKKKYEQTTSRFKLGEVMVYSPCMSAYNLGNSLGNYFNQIACAVSSNVYIIIAVKLWDFPFMPFEFKGRHHNHHRTTGITPNTKLLENHDITFFDALPSVYGPIPTSVSNVMINLSSSQPINITTNTSSSPTVTSTSNPNLSSRDLVKKICKCEKYCWNDRNAPWILQYALIGRLMNDALDAHLAANEKLVKTGMILKTSGEDGDQSSAAPDAFLPVIPDVAIQYRCGDTVPSEIYGFLPFTTMVSLIPNDTRTIYVLTDNPHRANVLGEKKFSSKCHGILTALFIHLQSEFSNATIVVKRGGDAFLDYARLSRSKVTICSASTFCLWPALAHTGKAYFPVTSLVAGWKPDSPVTPDFGPHFIWLSSPRIVTEFKPDTPIADVIAVLKETKPRSDLKTSK